MSAQTTSRSESTTKSNQPVYVLHTYPFKETSLLVEMFTAEFGRVVAVAKGARRPRSAMRGMLQSFQSLMGAWSGKAELKTLHSLDWHAGLLLLQGEALMCGFYLNELLLRLLPREDPHEALFAYYALTLKTLSQSTEYATTLRRFELKMLQELGYAVPLLHDANGQPIQPELSYVYLVEVGAVPANQRGVPSGRYSGIQLHGKTLVDMANDDYDDPKTKLQSKQLMRMLLSHYLGDKPLHTRQLLMDLQDL